jgi:NADPH:quinone reductase-like Zn-dependent oxidoreductase
MATMRAVRLHAFGGPDVLKIEEAPRPEPKDGEVLIKVHAAGVNPVDWKIREGYTNRKLPLVPGWDVAGVIEKVGSGVTSVKRGDAVYGYFDLSRNGAYADYVTVPAEQVALKPTSLDFTNAAAVPLAALTAWQGLFDVGGFKAGQKVLIHAAAGILVSILGQPSQKEADAHGGRRASFVVRPNAAELAQIADLVDSGEVKPVVETILPLSEARRAQELSQTGHTRGKIVLKVA